MNIKELGVESSQQCPPPVLSVFLSALSEIFYILFLLLYSSARSIYHPEILP